MERGSDLLAAIPRCRGTALAICENDAIYLRVHYTADASKRSTEYTAKLRTKLGWRAFEQQMNMSEDVYDGDPVFDSYNDELHCPVGLCRNKKLPLFKEAHFFGGWDCGMTLQPAFALIAVVSFPQGWQIHALLEVIPPTAEPMSMFAPRVHRALQQFLPGRWDEIEHWGDETVMQRSGTTGETAHQVCKALTNIHIHRSSNALDVRLGAMTWALQGMLDEDTPRFLIDGVNCPVLRDGFNGAYRWKAQKSSDQYGPGRILRAPDKNWYSHVQDALQYPVARAKKLVTGG